MIFNGKVVAEDAQSQLYHNRGFLYGDGFFETMRMHQGRLLWKKWHEARIRRSMDLLRLEAQPSLQIDRIEAQAKELAIQNASGPNVRIRLSIFRQAPGYYLPAHHGCGYMLQIKPLEGTYEVSETGLRAGRYISDVKHPGPYSGIKSLSAMFYSLAAMEAAKRGLDDLILCNSAGRLMEGLSSNLILVKEDALIAPQAEEGAVEGVMLEVTASICSTQGIPFKRKKIEPAEALEAQEILLCNVIRGLQWIRHYEGKDYSNSMYRTLLGMIASQSSGE